MSLLEDIRNDFEKYGVSKLEVNDVAYLFQTIDRLEKNRDDRFKKHFGYYGTACAATGQLDAGFCWKCQIEMLEERQKRNVFYLRRLEEVLHDYRWSVKWEDKVKEVVREALDYNRGPVRHTGMYSDDEDRPGSSGPQGDLF